MTKRFMEVKNGDLDLLKESESPEEFYRKVFAYHSDRAENLWAEGEKFSPEVFQKLADFLLPSFHRYWEKGIKPSKEKVKNAPPMSMADM